MIPGQRLRYDPYLRGDVPEEELGEEGDVRHGAFKEDPLGMYVRPEGLSYSEFGSFAAQAAYEAFEEDFADVRGAEWWAYRCDHGGHGILVRVDADDRVPGLEEFIRSARYGEVNGQRENELLAEATEEAWNSWGRREFIRKLVELDPDTDEDALDNSDDEVLRLRFAVDRAGDGPIEENGGVSLCSYFTTLERVHRSDPNALGVAIELAYIREEPGVITALDYLMQELSGRGGMPAFYYALLNYNPVAARILGIRPNADEFADAFIERRANEAISDLVDFGRTLYFAEALSRALPQGREQLLVLADAVEEGRFDLAFEMFR